MAKKLSTISYNPMVDGVSRKFARRADTCTPRTIIKSSGSDVVIPGFTYMGGSQRTVTILGSGPITKQVMFFRRPMAKPIPTSEQMVNRTNFSEASKWGYNAMHNLSVLSQNRAKINEMLADTSKRIKGLSPKGYQSYAGFCKAVAYAILAAEETLPQNYALPAFDA